MDRYIKRSDAVDVIAKYPYGIAGKTATAIRMIEGLPSADVVEVVRCKDCEYWDTRDGKGIQGICLCGEKDVYYGSEFYPFANDYCSYGERRK